MYNEQQEQQRRRMLPTRIEENECLVMTESETSWDEKE